MLNSWCTFRFCSVNRIISKLTSALPQDNGCLPVTGFEGGSCPRYTRKEAEQHIELMNNAHSELPFFVSKGRPTKSERQQRRDQASQKQQQAQQPDGIANNTRSKTSITGNKRKFTYIHYSQTRQSQICFVL